MSDNNKILDTILTAEFWRWVLKQYPEVPEFDADALIIHGCTNVFDDDGNDLTIDIEKRICTHGSDIQYELKDYVAICEDTDIEDADNNLARLVGKYEGKLDTDKDNAMYWFDSRNLHWYRKERKDSTDSKMVTNFNIVFYAVIKLWNSETSQWQRLYEVSLEYMKNGRRCHSDTFRLTPEETLNEKNFAKRIWEIDMLMVFLNNDKHTQAFFRHLDEYYKPNVITQYEYVGFIKHKGIDYYLSKDCLIRIPNYKKDPLKSFLMIAPNEQGAFCVDRDDYISLDKSILNPPYFDLSAPDPESNLFKKDMEIISGLISDDRDYEYQIRKVHDHIQDMVAGGDKSKHYEGTIILCYIFTYLIFNDIRAAYKHILYLYIYGPANSGKGKLAETILSFFGLDSLAAMSEPTLRSVENALENNSHIPTWIDEFFPDGHGKKVKISDQVFNTWFQLTPRNTSSAANRKRNELKEVRSMIIFTSNYLPTQDHIKSRSLLIEYAYGKRGPEHSFYWLEQNKKLLQQLFIATMVRLANVDRHELRSELRRYGDLVDKEATDIAKEMSIREGVQYQVYKRQSEQVGATAVVYNYITGLMKDIRNADLMSNDSSISEETKQFYLDQYNYLTKESVGYKAALQFMIDNLPETGESNDFSNFLSTVAYLVDKSIINHKHYFWQPEGHLLIYWNGIWNEYEQYKRGNLVNKDTVRDALHKLSVTESKSGTGLSWRPAGLEWEHHRGYKIPKHNIDKNLAYAFKSPYYTTKDNADKTGGNEKMPF